MIIPQYGITAEINEKIIIHETQSLYDDTYPENGIE